MADPVIESGVTPPETPPDSFRPTDTVRLEDAAPPEPVEPPPSSEPEKPAPGSQTPHARGMQAILEARRKRVEEEVAAGERMAGRPDPTPVPVETAPSVPPEPPVEPTAAPPPPPPSPSPLTEAAASPPPPAPPQPRVHRIVVRGQQIDLSEQDMVRAAQYAVEQEAARREAAYLEQERQRNQPPPEPTIDRPRLAETVKAIQFGDEETATEALAQLTREIAQTMRPAPAPPPQQIDPGAIADQVYQRVSNVQTLEGALTRFQNDYPDIVGDQQMTRLAALEAEDLRTSYQQQGIPRNVEQIMREAADNVRATINRWRGGAAPAPTPPTITPAPPAATPALAANGGRVAVKRSTPQAPAASSAPQPADTPNVRSGVTGSQIVDWMRRTRNQPVYR